MLDVYVHNLLSMKSFHGVLAGNVYQCLLKTNIGKVSFFHDRIRRVVDALVALEPAIIAPAHCAGYRAAYAVYQQRPDAFVQNTVGTRIALSAE